MRMTRPVTAMAMETAMVMGMETATGMAMATGTGSPTNLTNITVLGRTTEARKVATP